MDKEQNNFDIQDYMTKGVERVVSDAIKATLKNPGRKRVYGEVRRSQQTGLSRQF